MTDPAAERATLPIRPGDSGAAVRDVQRRLVRLGEDALVVDGAFGSETLGAVRRFQRGRGLTADGVMGPETWRALVEAGYQLGDRLLWQSQVMMRGDDVRELQRRLSQLGFDAGPEDGIFGPLVRAGLEEFQRNAGLEVDGVAGPGSVSALRRLARAHQSTGLAARVREREARRRLARHGLPGSRIVLDPAHGPDDPGQRAADGLTEAQVSWEIATRLAGRLAALGAQVLLTRGPATDPPTSARARFANEQGADLLLSVAASGHRTPRAQGASAYYFGSGSFVSDSGMRLAALALEEVTLQGWLPDCRAHPATWTILRETRMPTVVVEPGFLTNPIDAARLADPGERDRLAQALASAVGRFFELDAALTA